ncbi:MAG: enolase C-terminal domain-like protein [Myxococcota bacterium]
MVHRSGAVLSWRRVDREGAAAQRDRSWAFRSHLVLELSSPEAPVLRAEAAPLPGHSLESLEQVQAWLERWGAGWPVPRSDLASLDFALSDLQLQLDGHESEGDVHVNGLLDEVLRDDDLSALVAQGIDTVKVKVGRKGQADAEHRALSELTGFRIRADANRGMGDDFDPDAWAALALDLFEEPAPWSRAVRWAGRLPLAWDETVRELAPDDLLTGIRPRAVVLKPTLMGSFERLEAWARAARGAGRRVIFSHAYESELGLAALLRWTRLLAPPGERHGLLPHRFCAPDSFVVQGGIIRGVS